MPTLTRPDGTEPADLHVSRRGFASLVAAGYAAFATGADAVAVTTPATGLTAGDVALPGGLPGYVARPAGGGRHAAVIVVSEIFGVHEYIRDVCRRFAALGYVAVAPAFFHRADPSNALTTLTDRDAMTKIVATADNAQVMGDVGTTLDWLGKQDFVDPQRLAITGFCWGGAVVWMAAARFAQLKAGVAWYGKLRGTRPGMTVVPRSTPIEIAGELQAPVLGLYGGLDQGIPQADVEAMRAALKPGSSIVVYPQAEHGFHADYRPSYNAAAATDGWAKLLAHFKAHGAAPG